MGTRKQIRFVGALVVFGLIGAAVATHRAAHAHFRLMSHTPDIEAYQEFITGSELLAVDRVAAIQHLPVISVTPDLFVERVLSP